MEFLARPGQKLTDHLTGAAARAEAFAEAFHNADWGYTLGQLHDLEKKRKAGKNPASSTTKSTIILQSAAWKQKF